MKANSFWGIGRLKQQTMTKKQKHMPQILKETIINPSQNI